jgi:chromosome segregation ATPase
MKICILQNIAALEDDRETQEEKRDAIERELRAAEATKTMAAEEEREAAAALKRAEEKSSSMVEQVEPLTRDLIRCEEGIRKSRRDQEHYVAKKSEYMNNAKEKTGKDPQRFRKRGAGSGTLVIHSFRMSRSKDNKQCLASFLEQF